MFISRGKSESDIFIFVILKRKYKKLTTIEIIVRTMGIQFSPSLSSPPT